MIIITFHLVKRLMSSQYFSEEKQRLKKNMMINKQIDNVIPKVLRSQLEELDLQTDNKTRTNSTKKRDKVATQSPQAKTVQLHI